jgi:Family of unknown function (DUF5989)
LATLTTVRAFGRFLATRKVYWLVPMVVVLVLLGALLVFAEGSVVAPFIYTLF